MTQANRNPLLHKNILSFSVFIITLLFVLGNLLNIQQQNIGLLQEKTENIRSQFRQIKNLEERLKLEKDVLVIEKDKTIIQNNFYNGIFATIFQAIGGSILLATAYIGYRNFKLSEDNLEISQDKHLTDRFSKAIEHLGSDKIDVRLGGIYTLEQIAINSKKYHWTIVEILSAFIRDKSPRYQGFYQGENNEDETGISFISRTISPNHGENQIGKTSTDDEDNQPKTEIFAYNEPEIKKPNVDIIAAMVVLSRRAIEHEFEKEIRIDLRAVNLAEIEIANAKLNKINLGNAYLYKAYLVKADLSEAHLHKAYLNKSNLGKANLSKANLRRADLSESYLEEANLSGANLRKANLSKANLSKANLSEASDLSKVTDLSEACLEEANLSEANLSGANLKKANLKKANLSGADLKNANLIGVDLRNADLRNADLAGVNLRNADLRNADLRSANLAGVDLKVANIAGAQLDSVMFSDDSGDISGVTVELTGYKNGLD